MCSAAMTPDARDCVACWNGRGVLLPVASGEPKPIVGWKTGQDIIGFGPDGRSAYVQLLDTMPAQVEERLEIDRQAGAKEELSAREHGWRYGAWPQLALAGREGLHVQLRKRNLGDTRVGGSAVGRLILRQNKDCVQDDDLSARSSLRSGFDCGSRKRP